MPTTVPTMAAPASKPARPRINISPSAPVELSPLPRSDPGAVPAAPAAPEGAPQSRTAQLRSVIGPRPRSRDSSSSSDAGSAPAPNSRIGQGSCDNDDMADLDFETPGNLVLIKALGEGISGQVYQAVHRPTGRVLAKKTISTTPEAAVFEKILRELDINRRCVDSPHIARYYSSFLEAEDTVIAICMEYCAGGSLQAISQRYHQLLGVVHISEKVLATISSDVLSGLDYLHSMNVVHRDIKPSNILLTANGQTKICDFGVSGVLVDSIAGTFTGTSLFMAPERLRGEPCGINGDVWSLGLTIYQVATGNNPYDIGDEQQIGPFDFLEMVNKDPPPTLPPDTEKIKWTPHMRSFLKHTLAKDPAGRKGPKRMLDHPWIKTLALPLGERQSMARFVAGAWGWSTDGPPPVKIPELVNSGNMSRSSDRGLHMPSGANGPSTLRPSGKDGHPFSLLTPTTARPLRRRNPSETTRLGHASSTSSVSGSETDTDTESSAPLPPLTREQAAIDLEPSPAPTRPQQKGRSKVLALGLDRLTISTDSSPVHGETDMLRTAVPARPSQPVPQPILPSTRPDPLTFNDPINLVPPTRTKNKTRPKLTLAPITKPDQLHSPTLAIPPLSVQIKAPTPNRMDADGRPVSPHSLAAARQREQALGLVGEGTLEEFESPPVILQPPVRKLHLHRPFPPRPFPNVAASSSNDEAYEY